MQEGNKGCVSYTAFTLFKYETERISMKPLRTWNSDDVLGVYDSFARVHESINKLGLVPESF